MKTVLSSPGGKLIVSCQALENEPLHSPFTMSHMAPAAAQGGVVGIRTNSVADIGAIKEIVFLPVTGIIKHNYPGSEALITATLRKVDGLMTIEPEIIALDTIACSRPDGQTLEELIAQIRARYPSVLLMTGIATVGEAVATEHLGSDCVGITLYGYTVETAKRALAENDCGLLCEVLAAVSVPVVTEGNVDTPERTVCCPALGAHTVVVGRAVVHPQRIMIRFIVAITS